MEAHQNSWGAIPRTVLLALLAAAAVGLGLRHTSGGTTQLSVRLTRVTSRPPEGFARAPHLLATRAEGPQTALLLWREEWLQEAEKETHRFPIGWTVLDNHAASPRPPIGMITALTGHWSAEWLQDPSRIVLAFERNSYFRHTKDVVLWEIEVQQVGDAQPHLRLADRPMAGLPYRFENTAQPANLSRVQREFLDYRLPGEPYVGPGYARPALLCGASEWYLAGVRYSDETVSMSEGELWFSRSTDGGQHWDPPTRLGRGNYPHLFADDTGTLFLLYTAVKPFGYQSEWPDDSYPRPRNRKQRPTDGPLVLRLSTDRGDTWTDERAITQKAVIQAAGCGAPDGTLWVVYVRAIQTDSTSLWLTSSRDGGGTWTTPQKITDGKCLDREPDILWRGGKLLIAFCRAPVGGRTDVWLAELQP